MAWMRLDRVLSGQGICSRREAGAMARKGAVTVNGRTVRSADQKVDPQEDVIAVNGRPLLYKEYLYIVMNKPQGVVSASRDPRQKTVLDLLPARLKRRGLFPVGRLDKDTTGLLLITDDGDFAHRLTSPKKEVYKTYVADLDAPVGEKEVLAFAQGIVLEDGTLCRPAGLLPEADASARATVRICEGRYHQVKRMFEAVGRRVVGLHRTAIGNFVLENELVPGGCRELTEEECGLLRKNAQEGQM